MLSEWFRAPRVGALRRAADRRVRQGAVCRWLLRKNRVGFMVDAAISGFAVGAGFAVLENLTYIPDVSAAGLVSSAIRGLGTAMMHGGTTAIFGIVSVNLERDSRLPAPGSRFCRDWPSLS